MSPLQRTPLLPPEFMPRLAVTLAALAAYRLGTHVPLAGVDRAAFASAYRNSTPLLASFGSASELMSVAALGLMPLLSALLLLEVARLASPRLDAWADATPDNTRRLQRYACVAAVLLAAFQAYAMASGLEASPAIVLQPGLAFRVGTVTTLVAGTACLMWLATMISRYGLGSGFWMMLLATKLDGLPLLVLQILDLVRQGIIAAAVPLALLACGIAAVASLVALGLTLQRTGRPLDRVLVWPLFIAPLMSAILIGVPWALLGGPMHGGLVALLRPGEPVYLAAVALCVIVFSLAQWRRTDPRRAPAEPSTPHAGDPASPVLLTALALAALAVGPALLSTGLGLRLPLDGRWIAMLVVVAQPIAGLLRREAE